MPTVVETEQPTTVLVQRGPRDGLLTGSRAGDRWTRDDTVVEVDRNPAGGLRVRLAGGGEVSRIVLRWTRPMPAGLLVLGDAWERSYGDLGWEHLRAERMLPWYWLGHDQQTGRTVGAGVDVRPAAFCAWTVDRAGMSLWLDVRNGGSALQLGDRTIDLATVRSVGGDGPVPAIHRSLIDSMIDERLRPVLQPPLVGANNWYYAYGVGFDPDAVLGDARTIVELSDGHPVRPYSVIDDGWTPNSVINGGPWDAGTPGRFDDMAGLAAEIAAVGARPGLWFRPLRSREESDRALAIPRPDGGRGVALDPTRPEVRDRVAADLRRFADWGFELIKHDFSSFDIFGRFGPAMGMELTDDGWSFADRSRTNAEIINELYDLIRESAGDALVLGCNTVNHLAAGVVDAQRTGDDTSGRTWERTRRMGINTLAHRLAQHGRFFAVDADCVPCTTQVPWSLHRQFLDLVARSGTALFVSVDPKARTEQTDADLAAALRIALDGGAAPIDQVQPLDALQSPTPSDWRFGDQQVSYDWSGEAGGWPFPI